MPQRIARQAEYYNLPEASVSVDGVDQGPPRLGSLPDPEIFADLLGGPRITAGLLRVEEEGEG